MKQKLFLLFALAGLLFVAACADANSKATANNTLKAASNNTAVSASQPADDGHAAPRISLADTKKDYDAGTAFIVDVRDVNAYKNEHIKGAVNIPIADLATSMDKIPKDKKIIVYCS